MRKVKRRSRFWKYTLVLLLLFIAVAVFAIFRVILEPAGAQEYDDIPNAVFIVTPRAETSNENNEEHYNHAQYQDGELGFEGYEDAEESQDSLEPDSDTFILHMTEADIGLGYLVLVNHNHYFERPAPGRLDLAYIENHITTGFRVLGQNNLLERSVIPPLDEMMAAFIEETGNRTVAVISAFRNRYAQQAILDDHISRMGRTEALRWVAIPGYSEHHTGLAFDLGIYTGGVRSTFTGEGVTSWFNRNAPNFGFILRYPYNRFAITQTAFEPWHFRYVGLPHSLIITQNNIVLEEYIDMMRRYTPEEPLEFEHNGILYEIFFVAGTEVPIPFNSAFSISGNNADGFIVTINRLEIDPYTFIDAYT